MARLSLLLACVVLLTACPESQPPTAAVAGADAQVQAQEDAPTQVAAPVRRATGRRAVATTDPTPTAALPPTATESVLRRFRQLGGPLPPMRVPDPPWEITPLASFSEPWAMTFLPDGRLLVTEKLGRLRLLNLATGQLGDIGGVPAVAYGGQGGLGDVVLHPQFDSNGWVYLSYAEPGANGTRGAAVVRGKLTFNGTGGSLTELRLIWRQQPKAIATGHYSHRLAFDRAGKLWISSGDRTLQTPAQDMQTNLGKIVRLNDDGSVPTDNPYVAQGGVAAQVWSLGHRNVLGLAFDAVGRLWAHEMGPAGGDELNLIERGSNYGWPIVSNGSHYDGTDIPDHDTRPEFNAPEAWWTPVIAPAGFVIYDGAQFPYFRGDGFIGGLASMALIRIEFDGMQAREAQRYPMGRRIREVEQGPDGALWLLEDGVDARLLKLSAKPL